LYLQGNWFVILLFIYKVHFLYWINEKYDPKPTEGESTPEYKKINCMSVYLPKPCFRVRTSWRLKNILEMSTLRFQAGMAEVMILGHLISCPVCCSSRLPTKRLSRAAERRGSADCNSFVVHA